MNSDQLLTYFGLTTSMNTPFFRYTKRHHLNNAHGFSLVELMISSVIGLFLSGAVIGIYLTEIQTYQSTTSQASIQNAENAIAALVIPLVRSAGFSGCSTLTQSISNLNSGGSPPIGTLGTSTNMLVGYDASNTAGSGSAFTITQDNSANDTQANHWSPTLDTTLVGNIEPGSDVLVLLGATPGASPIGVTAIPIGGTTLTVQNANGLTAGQIAMVSDCLKTSVFQITSIASNTISHAAGNGVMANSSSTLAVNYAPGAQLIPLQQTAFYVAHSNSDQSTLMRATYNGTTWNVQPLVPGVETMQVLYGTGNNGVITQYVTAGAVNDWTKVYTVRLGFLMQGQIGSGTTTTASSRQFSVLGTNITVPADNRLRHVYEMTIQMRNSA